MKKWTNDEIDIIADFSPSDAVKRLRGRTYNDVVQARRRYGKGEAESRTPVSVIKQRSHWVSMQLLDDPSLTPDVMRYVNESVTVYP